MTEAEPTLCWRRVSEVVAERIGLHFPANRYGDLERGLRRAAEELGLPDVLGFAQRLLRGASSAGELAALATHLTVGETYFLRGKETFDALGAHVLPALIRARRGAGRRLRLWSAGCSTGEEAYSLAIVLHRILPDIADWRIEILATDINPRFLDKAAAGVYGEWSFRGVPAQIRQRYFRPTPDGRHAVAPEIRRMVAFLRLNLVQEDCVSGFAGHGAFDLILCRNVLMYFTPGQARRVVGRLHGALRDDGWLVVAPCEVSSALFADFTAVGFDDAVFHARQSAPAVGRVVEGAASPAPRPAAFGHRGPPEAMAANAARASRQAAPSARVPARAQPTIGHWLAEAHAWASQGRHDLVVDRLSTIFETRRPDAAGISLLANALANQGRLAEALRWCERWAAQEKMDARAHYLRAIVLIERGDLSGARAALQRSLYLEPDAAVFSYALADLERRAGRRAAAERHYRNALALLGRERADRPVPHAEQISCGQLGELVLAALEKDTDG